LQAVSLWQAVSTALPQLPLSAVLMQSAQGSVSEFTVPGMMQYSVAHWVEHPPVSLHTQFAMSWKYAVLPPVQADWQQSTHLLLASVPSHASALLVVNEHAPPLPPPEAPPLFDPPPDPLEPELPELPPLELELLPDSRSELLSRCPSTLASVPASPACRSAKPQTFAHAVANKAANASRAGARITTPPLR
jgi:hypothetical protein